MGNNKQIMKIIGDNKVPKPQKQCSRVGTVHFQPNQLVSKRYPKTSKQKIKASQKQPKTILNKSDADKHQTYHPKDHKLSELGFHLESFVRYFNTAACFSRPVFSKALGDTPLDRFWPPLGHPWSDCLDLLAELQERFCSKCQRFQNSISILRKQMAPTRPSKKQARVQKTYP